MQTRKNNQATVPRGTLNPGSGRLIGMIVKSNGVIYMRSIKQIELMFKRMQALETPPKKEKK